MKRFFAILLAIVMVMSLVACDFDRDTEKKPRKSKAETTQGEDPTMPPETTLPATTGTAPTETTAPPVEPKPTHSSYYISDLDTDTFLRYFSEVVLDAEFVNSGDATLVQKWNSPIPYGVIGEPTQEDEAAMAAMEAFLNSIPGFPGMYRVENPYGASLQIYFVSQEEMIHILGDHFYDSDGGVTIWWNDYNEIYMGKICIRTDLDQITRNSVIKEEIYNSMGPVQDTDLRSDSLIYSGFSTPQDMTQVDRLIMTLLYHPQIRCGMTGNQCEEILRELYY